MQRRGHATTIIVSSATSCGNIADPSAGKANEALRTAAMKIAAMKIAAMKIAAMKIAAMKIAAGDDSPVAPTPGFSE
jgi:hypothetical protein